METKMSSARNEASFKEEIDGKRFYFKQMSEAQAMTQLTIPDIADSWLSENGNLIIVKNLTHGDTITFVVTSHGNIIHTRYDLPNTVEPDWSKMTVRMPELT
jgi:hypothetical protein